MIRRYNAPLAEDKVCLGGSPIKKQQVPEGYQLVSIRLYNCGLPHESEARSLTT